MGRIRRGVRPSGVESVLLDTRLGHRDLQGLAVDRHRRLESGWFPAFAPQSGEFVTLQLADEAPIDTVWGFHTHDVSVWSAYDSITTMFAMVLAGWSARLDLDDGAEWRRLAIQFNPRSLDPEGGASRIVLGRSSAAGWPPPWCRAIGDPDLRPVGGPYEPIAAVLAGNSPPPVLIRGYSRGIAGGGDWATVAVIDDTAETRVCSPLS